MLIICLFNQFLRVVHETCKPKSVYVFLFIFKVSRTDLVVSQGDSVKWITVTL